MSASNSGQEQLIAGVLAGCRLVQEALRDTEQELGSMPIFVRPLVRRGFAKRTGRRMDEWQHLLDDLVQRIELASRDGTDPRNVLTRFPDLPDLLERLAASYRTAPERAARGMQDEAALRQVRERAARREQVVHDLSRALESLRAYRDPGAR